MFYFEEIDELECSKQYWNVYKEALRKAAHQRAAVTEGLLNSLK